jgi:hypothetical protein
MSDSLVIFILNLDWSFENECMGSQEALWWEEWQTSIVREWGQEILSYK